MTITFLRFNFFCGVLVSYLPSPVNSKAKHLPQILGPPPGKDSKEKPYSTHPSIVNGIWDKQVVDIPSLSHKFFEFLSVSIFIFTSHSSASFPASALPVQA